MLITARRNNALRGLCIAALLLAILPALPTRALAQAADPVVIKSFNSTAVATVTPHGGADGKSLTWTIKFGDATIIEDSPLGLELQGGVSLAKNLSLHGVQRGEQDETYDWKFGKQSKIRSHYKDVHIALQTADGINLELTVYAFDDGFAARIFIPKQEKLNDVSITREATAYRFPYDARCYALDVKKFNTSNEDRYTSGLLTAMPQDALLSLPLLVRTGDRAWAAITEAQLENYAGSLLRPSAKDELNGARQQFETVLAPWPLENPVLVKTQTPMQTPWRVVMLADNAGKLIESNMVMNLNPAASIDTSWIEPGLCGWDWWNGPYFKGDDFKVGMNNKTFERFIDFCGDRKIPYMLIDAGWYGDHKDAAADITKTIPDLDMPSLLQYAKARKVGLMLWLNWENVARQREEAFALYEQWGIKGVKIDYMNRDDQEMVDFYHQTLASAAKHHLTVDYHGAYKPTGERRTWPNLLTREGVQGLEYVKWSGLTDPDHDCMLPYTRMLAGPMDYTPGGFNNVTRAAFEPRNINPMVMGTRAHQLALYVVFESPLQMLADSPANYYGQPGLDFISSVPTAWDETLFLQGNVGESCVLARRKGANWYLGAITDWTARSFKIPLGFLEEGKEYQASINADGPAADTIPTDLAMTKSTVRKGDSLDIRMAPGGGQAIEFIPMDQIPKATPTPTPN